MNIHIFHANLTLYTLCLWHYTCSPLYIRPIDQRTGKVQPFASFDWISEEDSERILGSGKRLPRLLQSLQSCESDFICVQELQLEREETIDAPKFVLPQWITPLIDGDNNSAYKIILPRQSELEKIAERNRRVLLADVAITNAVFYKSNIWQPVEGEKLHKTTTCVMQAFLRILNNTARDKATLIDEDPIVITSIHLDACSEEKRVQQLQRCLEQSISCSITPYNPPIIVAGDFNCELLVGSCTAAFLAGGRKECKLESTEQFISQLKDDAYTENKEKECAASLRIPSGSSPTNKQLQLWDELHDLVTIFTNELFISLNRIQTGCTRAAYNHDEDTSIPNKQEDERKMMQWHLDHILYTPTTLIPLKRWSTLEDDPFSSKVGLPNDVIPTDHLPISAVFQMRPHPRLSEDAKEKLLSSLAELENRHTKELKAKNEEADRTRVELELHSKKGSQDESKSEKQQSKKSKKGKPPPEIIQHIRSNRQEMKELKARHRLERERYIRARTILSRIVLQRLFKGNLSAWIQGG